MPKVDLERDAVFLEHIVDKKYTFSKDGTITNIKTGKAHDPNNRKLTFSHNKVLYSINKPRAVWLAHKGVIEDGYYIHLKDKETGCNLNNLEIATEEEFRKFQAKAWHRIRKKPKVEKPPKKIKEKPAKIFSDADVIALRNEYREKPFSIRGRAREINISHPTIVQALLGKGSYTGIPDPIEKAVRKFSGNRKGSPRALIKKPVHNKPKEEKKVVEKKPRVVKECKPKEKVLPKVEIPKPPVILNKAEKPVAKPPMSAEDKAKRLEMIKKAASRMRGGYS